MIEIAAFALAPGVLALFVVRGVPHKLVVVPVAALLGWLLGYAAFHEGLGMHRLDVFTIEDCSSVFGAVLVLLAVRPRLTAPGQRRIFSGR